MDYECSELYYSHPIQVKYRLDYADAWHGAIGYHDFLITDSGVLKISDNFPQGKLDDYIVELSWIPISGHILGLD